MSTLHIVPLENVQGRYTEQWYRGIPKSLQDAGFNINVIDGEQLTDFVGVGTFLDIHTTIHYKNSQQQKVANLFRTGQVKDGDAFFYFDGEFWGGVEATRLLAQMNKLNVKIYAFFHAASWTKEDAFAVAYHHQKYIEVGWIAACDAIFVGSQYQKECIIDRRLKHLATSDDYKGLCDKIVVSGNPFFSDDYKGRGTQKKKKQLILPNRFDWEKRPNLSLDFAYVMKKRIPDLNIVVTTSHPKFKSNKQWLYEMAKGMESDGIIQIKEGLSKDEYHSIMAESKVMMSNSIEESFGICIVEAMMYNTYPLLRNELSHPELTGYDNRLLYNDEDQIIEKMTALLDSEFDVTERAEMYFTKPMKIMADTMR
jgi:glycosyltransferase involved in cell wall biosynthesis